MSTRSIPPFDAQAPAVVNYLKKANTGWMMRLFMLTKLPSAFFWGFRVRSCTHLRCEVSIPYNWFTQNPFRSTYFAAQCGAAEMSTGLLAITALQGRGAISMLVRNIEAEFLKKATRRVVFTCEQGQDIIDAVQSAIDSGEGREVSVSSVGVQEGDNLIVAKVTITWSFKVKKG